MSKKMKILSLVVGVLFLATFIFLFSEGDMYSAKLMRMFKPQIQKAPMQEVSPDVVHGAGNPYGTNMGQMAGIYNFGDPTFDFERNLEEQMNSLEYLGDPWVRLFADWTIIESCGKGMAEEQITLDEGQGYQSLDRYVDGLVERGAPFYISIQRPPNWACGYENPAPEDFQCAYPYAENSGEFDEWACQAPLFDPDDFYDITYDVVERYKDRTKYFGIIDEPTVPKFFTGTPAEFRDMLLIPGAQAVKDACPECFVVGPEFVRLWKPEMLQEMLEDGGWEAIDIVAIHTFRSDGGADNIAQVLEIYDDVIAPFGEKPLWVTATGKSRENYTDAELAQFYEDITEEGIKEGSPIRKIFFWQMGFVDSYDPFAIFDTSQTEMWNGKTIHKPRPAAEAYKEIIENWGKVETPTVKARVKAIFK
jgi:hypothetical protein